MRKNYNKKWPLKTEILKDSKGVLKKDKNIFM